MDPILVHSLNDNYADITPHNQLDSYTHNPEPPQNLIQIGDRAIIQRGLRAGLLGRIMSVTLPYVWVECVGEVPTMDNDKFGPRTCHLIEPMVLGQHHPDDDTLEWGDTTLILVHVEDTEIEPPVTLTYSRRSGYDVTVGDLVKVVQGRYWNRMGVVVSVDFCKAHMVICDGEKVSRFSFQYFSDNIVQLSVRISSCMKVSNWEIGRAHV